MLQALRANLGKFFRPPTGALRLSPEVAKSLVMGDGSIPENCEYRFTLEIGGKPCEIFIAAGCPVRNHETIFRDKDELTHCENDHALKSKVVAFSLNGSGRVFRGTVLWCPKCDKEPPDRATMVATLDGEFVHI